MCDRYTLLTAYVCRLICCKEALSSRHWYDCSQRLVPSPNPVISFLSAFLFVSRQLKVAVASGLPRSPASVFDDDDTGDHRMSAITFKAYTAPVAIPTSTRRFILNVHVMYSSTISTIIITRFASYVRFIFTSHGLGRVSICPSVRSLGSLSQRLLTSLPESLLYQFAKATAALFRTSLVDTSSEASI